MSDTPASDPGPTGGDTPLPQVGRDGAAFWGGLLAPGETLRWHGAPDPRLFTPAGGPAILAVLAGGAGTGIVIALRAGGSAAQAVAGIGLFVLSALQLARRSGFGNRRLLDTRYALSDRAIYIATLRPGAAPHLERYPLTPHLAVGLGRNSVTFPVGVTQHRNEPERPLMRGFFHIHDAAAVQSLVREIQRGMT
ncbi:hypothetical protein EOW65_04195 [Sinirhodobacter ferrireducens]|uniref:Aspartate carbamoyltransferase catalytic subunit n=1 Tax=Paenirhodobacter ferrireducens TaxID=1215032 RepID=A0A443LQD2_9RHOB|nr:hypothetical protein [Sinirhodobacter ferrireducens]RWR51372.1 hypothetical protein EOW65_04195 [Sinirhodobacter ferrireducens]